MHLYVAFVEVGSGAVLAGLRGRLAIDCVVIHVVQIVLDERKRSMCSLVVYGLGFRKLRLHVGFFGSSSGRGLPLALHIRSLLPRGKFR